MSLLAVDLDGTLLDPSGSPHAHDVNAIRAAIAAGVRVTIVTGRLYSGTRTLARHLGLEGAVGCADGSHLVRSKDDTTLQHIAVQGAAATKMRDVFAAHKAATFVFARDAIGHDLAGAPYVNYVATWSRDIRIASDVFGHELWTCEEGITAVVAVGTREQIERTAGDLARDLKEHVLVAAFPMKRGLHTGSWAMIVRATGGTKGTAIRWIAEHEGVALEDTVCVGDWVNDLPMFEIAGRSFAMGQAPDEVKAKASDILEQTCVEGGGIATAIETAFGIRAR